MQNKIIKVLSYILVALIASALTLFLITFAATDNYSKLDQLEDLILDKFIGDKDRKVMEDGAAAGMIAALGDRWSFYLSAEEFQDYQEQMQNAYVGIGVTISGESADGLNIMQVTPGGSAEEAGLLAGDRIIAVDGQDIRGKNMAEVREKIRGEEGTDVLLTVVRGEKNMDFRVTRKTIETPVATGEMLEGNIGLVTIHNFDSRCAEESIAAIEQLTKQGAEKLIFDVRNNPGGYKNELVKVLDYLLPEGVLFRSELYNGKTEEDRSDAACVDLPMAVLVNGDSYSAAEFFGAALRDYEKGILVGQKTCGKGYFQSTFPLKDGSAVGLSIGKYFTPKGESLAGIGLTPDVPVEVDDATAGAIYAGTLDPAEDPQIQAAVEALKKG